MEPIHLAGVLELTILKERDHDTSKSPRMKKQGDISVKNCFVAFRNYEMFNS